ncbi:MAG: hypothetical protein A4E63_01852 [Syntrophorhabdus sp. PtaU1.Bin050]|nr:MAG: hypothetical protein A4E63_01852 [Syntrophorhabdus sp. PtaU1.Bin050]
MNLKRLYQAWLERLVLIITVATFVVWPFTCISDTLFKVSDYSFCKHTVNNQPIGSYDDSSSIDVRVGEELCLWLEIYVTRMGLIYLQSHHSLPVYAIWGKDGWLNGGMHDIGIKPENWIKQQDGILTKSRKSNDSGFTWRTRTKKKIISSGKYYVSILDANRKSVSEGEDGINVCRPGIQIKVINR